MTIEFLQTVKYDDFIEIDDPGNTCISVFNDQAEQWLMSIKTELGWTEIVTIGPLNYDLMDNGIGYNFTYNYHKEEYNEKKIFKAINFLVNDGKKVITQVQEIPQEEFDEILDKVIRDNYKKLE